jgi:hypothetical protein
MNKSMLSVQEQLLPRSGDFSERPLNPTTLAMQLLSLKFSKTPFRLAY